MFLPYWVPTDPHDSDFLFLHCRFISSTVTSTQNSLHFLNLHTVSIRFISGSLRLLKFFKKFCRVGSGFTVLSSSAGTSWRWSVLGRLHRRYLPHHSGCSLLRPSHDYGPTRTKIKGSLVVLARKEENSRTDVFRGKRSRT